KGADSLDVAVSLNRRGIVAQRQGDLSAAKEYHQRALILRERQAPDSLDVSMSLGNLGMVAYDQGDLATAKDYYQRTLTLQEKLAPHSLEMAENLYNLGTVAWKQKQLTEAEQWARRAWDLVRTQAAGITGDEARQAFGASAINYAVQLIGYQLEMGQTSAAFTTLEESRAQALQQLLLERHI